MKWDDEIADGIYNLFSFFSPFFVYTKLAACVRIWFEI